MSRSRPYLSSPNLRSSSALSMSEPMTAESMSPGIMVIAGMRSPKDCFLTNMYPRVVASANKEGTVYVSLNGKRDDDFADYLYKSTDFGKTWADISANIPGGPINVVREDPKNEKVLYVGTDLGVYISIDEGKSWHVLGSKLPTTFVHDLVVHPRDSILVVATHGRGMWAIDVSSIQKK